MSYVSRAEARQAVLLPCEHSTRELQRVFERGYVAWQDPDGDSDDVDGDAMISEVERVTYHAITPDTDIDRDIQPDVDPIVDQPAVLAVVATLGTVVVCNHPALEETPRRNIELVDHIRDLYIQTAQAFLYADETANRLQWLAEHLYQKAPSEDGPHPGRVCTGVEQLDDGHHYLQVPLPAASPECIARLDGEDLQGGYDAQTKRATGEVVSRLENNAVYVPVAHLLQTHQESLAEQFDALVDAQEKMLTDEQRQWLVNEADAITDRIDRFLRSGHRDLVWSNWDADTRRLRALRSALLESGLDIDTAHTPAEVFAALEQHDPDIHWERDIIDRFRNPAQVRRTLDDLVDDGIEIEPMPEGVPDQYRIREVGGATDDLQVTEIEDLFELPCFAAMDERLQEKGPVRKDLYNFARLVMWLPGYRGMDLEALVEAFHDVFERWPWYDPAETDYQIRYEFENEIEGETPLPMGCSNPDMQRYCIGREECPYSIYGSLPFPDELYEQLE